MKIAVDARPLNFPYSGIGKYTIELLTRLVDSEYEWHLLFTPKYQYSFLQRDNVVIHHLSNKSYLDALIINFHTHALIRKIGIELFWSPRHHLPFFLPQKTKKILSIHDIVWKRCPETMTKFGLLQEQLMMPRSIKSATEIISVSKSTTKDLCDEFQIEPHRCKLIPPAVNANFHVQQPVSDTMEGDTPYFLFVGTNEPRKNLVGLFQAYSSLTDETKMRSGIVIVGNDGWNSKSVKELIELFNLSKHVIFHSDIDENELIKLYDKALFLALPSLYEGFGIPILEALTRGKPVLTSNNSSMPEVASSCGHYINPYSVASIKEGLEKMINDVSYRNNLSSSAKRIAANYSWDNSAKTLLEVIEEISSREGQQSK